LGGREADRDKRNGESETVRKKRHGFGMVLAKRLW
jgi:hypothetical protein